MAIRSQAARQPRPNRAPSGFSRPAASGTEHGWQAELSNSLRMLAASIAHEVNQPLSGIITNARTCLRLLSAEAPNVEDARETVRRTIRDVERAAAVVDRLRALFARSEPVAESVNLNQVVLEVLALCRSELDASRVAVTCDLAGDLPLLVGDCIQLQQVLQNLVRNAAEALNGVHDRPREMTITTQRLGRGQVRLSVRDAGVGFRHGELDRLFTPFYTTKAHGMGMGLCISRSIVEKHRGRLSATANHDGPGVTFSLSIPCAPPPPAYAPCRSVPSLQARPA